MTGISVPADLILFLAFPLNQHGFSVDAKMSIIPLELATYRKPLAEHSARGFSGADGR